jgi:hypothetical protein
MGNNFVCENYYCQDIILKPEWFSENSWNITYNYFDEIFDFKPYIIDKGMIKLKGTPKFNLLISKKLNINLKNVENFVIPIHFNFYIDNYLSMFIILSNNELKINELKINELISINDNLFYFKVNLNKKKIIITRSYDDKIFKINKIKSNLDNYYNIELKNNNNSFSINEKFYKNNKEMFDYNSSNTFNKNLDNIYLSVFICSKNEMINKSEYFNINFE